MVWWEAVLSPALQVLFDKLASGADDIIDFLRSCNISDFLLEELKVAYFTNAALLDDAETKQFHNPAVDTWLGLLKEAVFAAEDLLDELATEALRQQLGNNHQVTWSLIPSYFTRSNDNCHEGLDSRIALIINRLNCIAKQKSVLGLKEDGGVKHRAGPRRSVTTPSIMESQIFGRDHDREEIIKSLFAEDNEEIGGREVCILAMGGVGKTVVAQLVFNDRRVDEYFDVKAWACVSEHFNLVDLTKSILESVTDKPWETTNLELLQTSLCRNLNKKKFLIVLDDVWTENYEEWCNLRSPFLVGAPGSRIILTTPNESVLSVTRTCKLPYRLGEVSDDACWSLLSHHAFQGKTRSCSSCPELEVVGREIASKCKGLPLAAITLGRVLRSKEEEVEHWYQILRRRNFWDFSLRQSSILPTLLLSYYHLPANLRRCFAYCSIFPKGYEFDVEKLVRLWMAEGFVQQGEEEDRTMEKLGMEYFHELLSRSFFRKSTSSNEQPRYVMHDAINELARFVSRKTCLSLESNPDLQVHVFSDKVRHFSYIRGKYDVYKKFEALSGSEWVRTFLPLPPEEAGFCYLSSKVVKDLLPRLRCLRVLSLSGYCIEELPESIGQFKHLRYLDLSCTAIKALPSSVCTLFNLQTLMLNDCDALTELPENLTDLINLRYFDISGSGVQDMPIGMGKLRNLQVLPEFVVGSEIGEMRNLLHLQGKVTLSRLENVVNAWDARKANLTTKKGIKELVLEWTSNFNELQDHNIQTAVFEMLQPHQFLQIIRISYFNGLKFPTWLGDPFFSNMVKMSVAHCKKCSSLPPFGQLPLLRELHIEGLASVESVGIEFYGDNGKPFPSLEVLTFKEMQEWENWTCCRIGEEEIEAFPKLHTLQIVQCPNLKGKLPNHLPCLETLIMHETEQWIASLPRLPSLDSFDISGCTSHVLSLSSFSLLSSLQISEVSNFTHLRTEMVEGLQQLKHLQIMDCGDLQNLCQDEFGLLHMTSLQSLIVRNCPLMTSLCNKLPSQLEYLELENCRNLVELPRALHTVVSLRELTIKDCPNLTSFPPDTSFPVGLRGLMIRGCGLVSLPKEIMESDAANSLEYLYISGCYDLVSFPDTTEEQSFPASLQQLTIDHCPNLSSLPNGMMQGSNNLFLKVLEIFDCSSLVLFPNGILPPTLKTLTIFNCASLESLSDILVNQDHSNSIDMVLESFRVGKCPSLRHLPNGMSRLSCLDYFEIEGCPGVVSFPEGGLPFTNLKKVHIINCENLSALPEGMQNLTSLEDLSISDCPRLLSLPVRGLPINLVSLEIKGCDNISEMSDWGLHRLNSLKKLCLSGGKWNSSLSTFPEWLLSPTITSLQLGKLPKLDFESNWLHNLTALEDLKLKDCPHLPSLPLDKLPQTLSCLEISGCPLVEQQCVIEWEWIDHLPWVV